MARNKLAGKHPSYKKRKMSKKAIANKRAYDKKYASSTKRKKYRAALNRANRKAGTYGNGDKKDMHHKKGGGFRSESQSINRGRKEKSRLRKKRSKR